MLDRLRRSHYHDLVRGPTRRAGAKADIIQPNQVRGSTRGLPREWIMAHANRKRALVVIPALIFLGLSVLFAISGAEPARAQAARPDSTLEWQRVPDLTSSGADGLELTPEDRIRQLNMQIQRDPTNGDLYNNLGVVYAEQADWVPARDAFISAVQAKPMEADFHRNLGMVLVAIENYDMAVMEFEAYQRFDLLGNRDGSRLVGDAYRRAGRLDEAEAAYRGGLESLAPDLGREGLRIAVTLADLYKDRHRTAEARTLLEEHLPAAERILRDAEAAGVEVESIGPRALKDALMGIYVDDGKVLEDSGLSAEAAELYGLAFALAPEHGEILVRLITQHLASGAVMEARVAARMAREDYPELPGAWLATGHIYEEDNRFQDAVDAYLRARELDPGNTDLDLRIGNLYMKLGDSAKARKYMSAGIESGAASPEVVYNYGAALLREKRYHLAVNPLRKAVAMKPDLAPGWRALAQALRLSDRPGPAVAAYEKALEFGDDARLRFNLASCQAKSGDSAGAVASYRLSIELDPTFRSAYRNLSNTLFRAKRYAEAIEAYEQQLAVDPDKYTIYFNQGYSLFQLERYDEAVDRYELALEEKETADLFNNIGAAYDKLGRKEDARSYYELAKEAK